MELNYPQTLYHKEKIWKVSGPNKPAIPEINKESRLIVLYDNPSQELPAHLKEMLIKLIQACRFKPEETTYVNFTFSPISLQNINCDPELILIFGDLKISRNTSSLFKNQPYELNGIKILRTERLEKLEQMKAEKAALWSALQQTLNLK
jgi:DNA polymerase III psi subunit